MANHESEAAAWSSADSLSGAEEPGFFTDRSDGGRQLAALLQSYRRESPVVLAIPRGGVPVGFEIAQSLQAPLDVLVARKLGAPGRPEFAMGAIAPGGVRVLNEEAVEWLRVTPYEIEEATLRETEEMNRRIALYRGRRLPIDVKDRTVIMVDDGLATGYTARAAVQSIRKLGPRRLVVAMPVCAVQSIPLLKPDADEMVCVLQPADLYAVGMWYRDFHQVSDTEVIDLLKRANEAHNQADDRPRASGHARQE